MKPKPKNLQIANRRRRLVAKAKSKEGLTARQADRLKEIS